MEALVEDIETKPAAPSKQKASEEPSVQNPSQD